MAKPISPDISSWYRDHSETHEGLASVVASTLINLLKAKKIDHLVVSTRIKTLDGVIEKMARKEYASPDEITDLTGIRVITYIESDIAKVSALIEGAFKVDTEKSINKSDELRADRFGYRSVHYICELGNIRTALPELARYKGFSFEIQIRTVLQHAWAEIEHDRSYKFSGDLPTPIRRRLNLLAGMLEMADREFSSLANEVDIYAQQIHKKAKAGELAPAEITSLSVREFIKSRPDLAELGEKKSNPLLLDTAIREWKDFGLTTIDELDGLLSKDLVSRLLRAAPPTTYVGLARRAMMYSDLERYLARVYKKQWKNLRSDTFNFLAEKYGVDHVNKTLARYGLDRPSQVISPAKLQKPSKK